MPSHGGNKPSVMRRLPRYSVLHDKLSPDGEHPTFILEQREEGLTVEHQPKRVLTTEPEAVHRAWSGGDHPVLVEYLWNGAKLMTLLHEKVHGAVSDQLVGVPRMVQAEQDT
jgi:hypothetical protein